MGRVPADAVFLAADEPLLAFASARDAQGYIEAVDVENGVYTAAYGPSGEAYSVTTQSGLVFVERIDGAKNPNDLYRLLLNYMEAAGRAPATAMPLDELVATVWAVANIR